MSKQPHPHLLQAQYALVQLLSKLEGRPGTGNLPSTIVPPDHPLMVLGKLSVLGRPTNLDKEQHGPTVLAVGAGGGGGVV